MPQNDEISVPATSEERNSRKLLADIFAGISPPEDVVEGRA